MTNVTTKTRVSVRRQLMSVCGSAVLALLLLHLPASGQAGGNTIPKWMQIAAGADAIMQGTCTSASSHWDDEHRFIVTDVQFEPSRSFKGEMAGPLTVRVLGGRVGDIGMDASHGATLSDGEQVVLLLQRSRFGSYFVIAGGEAGKLAVEVDAATNEPVVEGGVSLDDLARRLGAVEVLR
jgi:hypothetical protein